MLLVVTADDALLEGLVQALAATGQRVQPASSLDEAAELSRRTPPLLMIVDRALLSSNAAADLASISLAAGGAWVTFRTSTSRPQKLALPPALARGILADIELPLERTRLVALAEFVTTRARKVARPPKVSPPESPAG